ncbi:MAG: preprotein translocase subunit SecY [Candidatus Odinarchaeota archaeon]
MSRFLNALRPLVRIMPEVKAPDRKVSFREKFAWTAIILIIYLIMANLPLYGIQPELGFDYFFWLRTILASQRGTLMELGIGPIVTAGLIMQLLVGSQLIRVDMSDPYQRSLYTGAQKVLAVFMTAFQSIAYIFAGAYGALGTEQLRFDAALLVFLQLMFAGIIVILMDETIQKGWGLGSGVSLFIMANVCTQILWGMFSITPAQSADIPFGAHENFLGFSGIFPYTIQNLNAFASVGWNPAYIWDPVFNVDAPIANPYIIWIRPQNPRASMLGVFTTFLVFVLVIYMESYRVNIPLQYARYRGFRGQYPIKLLYVSNIPVIFTQALYANILFITQILWTNPALGLSLAPGSPGANPFAFWFQLIARYTQPSGANYLVPEPICFVWFLTPPTGIGGLLEITGGLQAVGYAVLLMLFCAGFARLWIDVSGISPRDVSRQLIGAGMQVPGFRRSPAVIEKILNRYIPVVAILGGLIIGALAAFADLLGTLSTGIGILLAVGIMRQYFEILAKEQLGEMHPMMRGLLGIE